MLFRFVDVEVSKSHSCLSKLGVFFIKKAVSLRLFPGSRSGPMVDSMAPLRSPPARCQLLMSRRLPVYRLDLDRNKVTAFTDARKKTPRLVLESRISSSSATLACSSDLAAPIHNDTLSSSKAIHYMCALLPRRLTALSQVLN